MLDRERSNNTSYFKYFMILLYAVSFGFYLYFVYDGISFYWAEPAERVHHELYRNLRPAGFRGHAFGIWGTFLMLIMLLYSARKRFHFLRNFFPLSHWLQLHIYCGIMGPLLIILHTAFKVQGLVALSFWSMIAVAGSGILGRYLYIQIPRTLGGEELSEAEISKTEEQLQLELQREFLLTTTDIHTIESIYLAGINLQRGTISLLLGLLLSDILRPFRLRKFHSLLKKKTKLTDTALAQAFNLIKRKALLHRRSIILERVQQLFHYWHVIHKPFALVMYLILIVHVGIAIWMGYTWIF